MPEPLTPPDVAYLRIGTKNTTRLWHPKPHPTIPWYSVPYYSQAVVDELRAEIERLRAALTKGSTDDRT